jgi:hypothetical protein
MDVWTTQRRRDWAVQYNVQYSTEDAVGSTEQGCYRTVSKLYRCGLARQARRGQGNQGAGSEWATGTDQGKGTLKDSDSVQDRTVLVARGERREDGRREDGRQEDGTREGERVRGQEARGQEEGEEGEQKRESGRTGSSMLRHRTRHRTRNRNRHRNRNSCDLPPIWLLRSSISHPSSSI